MSGVSPTPAATAELEFIRQRVDALLKHLGVGIFQVGHELLKAKALLPHGQFATWTETNLRISARTAERFMAVARRLGDNADRLTHLPAGVLYELAAPSTPDTVVKRVLSGQIAPTVEAIRNSRTAKPKGDRNLQDVAAARLVRDFQAFHDSFPDRSGEVVRATALAAAFSERFTHSTDWAWYLAAIAEGAAETLESL